MVIEPNAGRAYGRRSLLWIAVLLFALTGTLPAAHGDDCGGPTAPCRIDSGEYYVLRPSTPPPPSGFPAVLHLHGWSSSAEAVLARAKLVAPILARGYALIVPQGDVNSSGRRDWSVRDGQTRPRRDDVAFLRDVAADATRRFSLDRSRILLTGFSRGGSMVWDTACVAPRAFAAYAPFAGGFWEPLPKRCAGPVRLLHTHGWSDGTVPLEGRRLGGPLVQGNIMEGLVVWRETNGCAHRQATKRQRDGERLVRIWEPCLPGSDLRFVLHAGHHVMPQGWPDDALDWFERGLAETTGTSERLVDGR